MMKKTDIELVGISAPMVIFFVAVCKALIVKDSLEFYYPSHFAWHE